jgi:hypothetical protein
MNLAHYPLTLNVSLCTAVSLFQLVKARPPHERRRQSLRTALMAIAGVAVIFGAHELDRRGVQMVVSVVVTPAGAETTGFARELVSPAVLDNALSPPPARIGSRVYPALGRRAVSGLPRLRGATDPRAKLRRLLKLERLRKTRQIRVSLDDTDQHDASRILEELSDAWRTVLGPSRVASVSSLGFHSSLSISQAVPIFIVWTIWGIIHGRMLKTVKRDQKLPVDELGHRLAELIQEWQRIRAPIPIAAGGASEPDPTALPAHPPATGPSQVV